MDYKFLDNKYTRWYFGIIDKRLDRKLEGYGEKHHILPKSLGGSNKKFNIIKLTAREHFIVHLLLVRMVQKIDVYRMVHAIVRFSKKVGNSMEYELLRKSISRFSTGEYNKSYGKIWVHKKNDLSIEYILKEDFDNNVYIKGLPYQRGGFKDYKWINNGEKSTLISKIDKIPKGWSKGRSESDIPSLEHIKFMSSKRHTKEKDLEHKQKMTNRVHIVKNNKRKIVKKEEVCYYYEKGWKKFSKNIIINSIEYNSMKEAGKILGISPCTIRGRVRSDTYKWLNWQFKE